tara:strand:- start:404 stop:703 length:300 start_codon:yes stop_codon:yes gene_type:complete
MANLNQYEREEVAYEIWCETGGPELQAIKDKENMNIVLDDIEQKGWEVLKRWKDSDGYGGLCEHVVLMNGEQIVKAYYHRFNKGLMEKGKCGSYPFEPI